MPTTRPRHQITETETIATALDRAAKRWPGDPRSRLLMRLVVLGSEALADDDLVQRRRQAVRRAAGKYGDLFGEGYLERLRDDWPE